jgi:hypothetical protein
MSSAALAFNDTHFKTVAIPPRRWQPRCWRWSVCNNEGPVTPMHKMAGIAQVTGTVVRDPAISASRRKVVLTNDDHVGCDATHLRFTLKDGTTLKTDMLLCRSSVARPVNNDDVTVKNALPVANDLPICCGRTTIRAKLGD